MDTDQYKAILTYKVGGELQWAYDDFDSWTEVRKEAGQLLKETSKTSENVEISAVSNFGESLEISKEESVNNM